MGMSAIRVVPERDLWLPGETLRGTVELHVDRPLRARGVRLRLRGREEIRIETGSGDNRSVSTERSDLIDHEVTFAGRDRIEDASEGLGDAVQALFGGGDYLHLPIGDQSFDFEVPLPDDCISSFDGHLAKVAYQLVAYVDVPAGADVRERHPIYMVPPPRSVARDEPIATDWPTDNASAIDRLFGGGPMTDLAPDLTMRTGWPEGAYLLGQGMMAGVLSSITGSLYHAFGNRLHTGRAQSVGIRAELPRQAYSAGETINGSVSISNPQGVQIRGIDVSLVAQEDARAHQQAAWHSEEHTRASLPAPTLPSFSAEFALQIPPNARPTAAGLCFAYNWAVKVLLEGDWGMKAALPAAIRGLAGPVCVVPIAVSAAGR
jgi:hypothetical protein